MFYECDYIGDFYIKLNIWCNERKGLFVVPQKQIFCERTLTAEVLRFFCAYFLTILQ